MTDLGYAWNAYLLVTYCIRTNVSLRDDYKFLRETRVVLNEILLLFSLAYNVT